MCGHDWCSVRISKEINEFLSGKDEKYEWDKPKKTASLTPEQQEILAKRGVLSEEEIHKLAHKGKKAECHSDIVKDEKEAKLVQISTLKAHGVAVNESGL